jgi:hypothetical protein
MALRFVPVDRHHLRRVALMYDPGVSVVGAGPKMVEDTEDRATWISPTGPPLTFSARHRNFRPYYVLAGGVPYWMVQDALPPSFGR